MDQMIHQNTPEWHELRLGKVTASRVADIMRKGKGGAISMSRARYAGELVAERLTGTATAGFKSSDMEWGNETEALARDAYAYYHDALLIEIAFVPHKTIGMTGASPDRLVGDDGLLEIKCPATHTHIATLEGAPIDPDYLTQMQWQMACTGRSWCDWVSFDPRMPEPMRLFVKRVERDSARIAELETEVIAFLAEVRLTVHRLRSKYDPEKIVPGELLSMAG
jgi:putative phage-type endonuclease